MNMAFFKSPSYKSLCLLLSRRLDVCRAPVCLCSDVQLFPQHAFTSWRVTL